MKIQLKWGRVIILKAEGRECLCLCDCGTQFFTRKHSLISGHTQSCGCLRKGQVKNYKHGLSKSPEYRAWQDMKNRCYRMLNNNFHNYGGRGIRVCDEWLNDFETFLNYVGPRPSSEYSLDRYPDVDGNYAPGNVRWATRSQQQRNKR